MFDRFATITNKTASSTPFNSEVVFPLASTLEAFTPLRSGSCNVCTQPDAEIASTIHVTSCIRIRVLDGHWICTFIWWWS